MNPRSSGAIDFHSIGWTPLTPVVVGTTLDVVSSGPFTVSRSWTPTAAEYALVPQGEAIRVLLTVEGEARMLTHRGTSLLEAGQVMLLGSREAVEVRTESQWARFEWQLRPTILRSPVFAECFERPLPLQTLGSRMLMFTANAMLNQPVEESERAFGHYSLAAEQLVAGGLPIAGGALGDGESTDLERALRLIRRHAHEQDFTVTALARLLRCSESHLHRIFEASSETPRRAIERYRIEEAQRLLASGSPERRRDRGWVAQAAGFSSAAHLQRVLRREAASHATQQGVAAAR